MKKLLWIGLVSLLFFSSCDGKITVTLYVQDLLDLATNNENIVYTNATIIAGGVSQDEQMDFIRNNINGVSNEIMTTYNYSEVYQFDIKVPILGPDVDVSSIDSKDIIYMKIIKNGEKYSLMYGYNNYAINNISYWVENQYYQSFDMNGYDIVIKIDNDSRNDFMFNAKSIYANGEAYPFEYATTIRRRENSLLQISSVLRDAILAGKDELSFIFFQK